VTGKTGRLWPAVAIVAVTYQFRHARLQDRLAQAVVPNEPHRPS